MSTRAARAFRGAVFAAIAIVTAAAGHTIGGGAPPSPLYCATLFALAVPLATALAPSRRGRQRPRLWRTALAVGASQALFHAAFAVVGDPGASPSSMTAGHAHGTATTWATDAAAPLSASAALIDPGMTIAHVIAGIITILLVLRGESALAAIAAWIVGAAAAPLEGPIPPRVPRRVASIPTQPRTVVVVPPGLGRRGPPSILSSPIAA